jgi:pimeloyl-ACP methyl ester carboxylesterase
MQDVGAMLRYVTQPANAAKFRVNTGKIVVIGHSMGGFLAAAALAQHPELAAGVIITEGSPINDGAGYFGPHSDPADYAPLAGTSPAALEREAKANAGAWNFAALAAQIMPRPLLLFSANDGLRPSNEALRDALKHAGSAVTYVHMDTDHGFSDHRIALEKAVLLWLDKTVQ